MRQRQKKEVFINTLKKEILVREMLIKFFNTTFNDVVKSFDGKVYNKRFDNALNQALRAVSPAFSATCTQKAPDSYSNYKNMYVEVILEGRTDLYDYTKKEQLYTKIMLDRDENYNQRINANIGKDEKYVVSWYNNFVENTKEIQTAIKDYDKYIKVAQKVADAIDSFKNLPFRFRQNIEFTTKFYLNN